MGCERCDYYSEEEYQQALQWEEYEARETIALEEAEREWAYQEYLKEEITEKRTSMTNEEAIKIIEIAIAEVEWNYPLEYSVAFEKAIEALKNKNTP